MIEFVMLLGMALAALLVCISLVWWERRHPPTQDDYDPNEEAWEDQYDSAYWFYR